MRITTIALGACCALTLGLRAPAGDAEGEGTSLKHKAHKKWDYVLPGERWHTVDAVITLPGGLEFETKAEGPLKLRVDTNADGRLDKDVKGQDGFLTLSATTDDGEPFRYSIRFKNVAAGKWEWATGSSMSGKVDGTLVHVFDQDGNGRYDDYGVDAIAIGSSTSAALLSKVVAVDGELFSFSIAPDGTSVRTSSYDGPTGLLSVEQDYEARGKLTAAVFRSGDLSFQVAGHKKGLTVPVGRYDFVSGRVERGSASASIRRGRMHPVEVEESGTTTIEWGEKVEGEFNFSQTGTRVSVQADFTFFGAGGEEYYDFQPRGKGPKIIIKDQKRGRDLKEGRFPES